MLQTISPAWVPVSGHEMWKILKYSTHPTCPYVFVNSIIYFGNSQNFDSSCSMKYSQWRADDCILSPESEPLFLLNFQFKLFTMFHSFIVVSVHIFLHTRMK